MWIHIGCNADPDPRGKSCQQEKNVIGVTLDLF